MTRHLALLAALAAVAALGLAACGGDGETTTAATTEPPPATTAPPPPPPPPPPTETKTVTIVYRNGKVDGGIQRQSFKKGEMIVIVARSDVPEELHVHGYDESADLMPGKQARLAFPATLVGGFEVELEERGLQVAELTVSP